VLETTGIASLTNAALADHASMSERTVYRHFPTRDLLLDALAEEVMLRMNVPQPPRSLVEVRSYARALFRRFEAVAPLTRAALSPELFDRIRDSQAAKRWAAIEDVLDREVADAPALERHAAAAQLRYLLSATTWNYYRCHFRFGIQQAEREVSIAVELVLRGLTASVAGNAERPRTR
jgi:AcrR family transcriptional regulator